MWWLHKIGKFDKQTESSINNYNANVKQQNQVAYPTS